MSSAEPGCPAAAFEGAVRRASLRMLLYYRYAKKTPFIIDKYTFLHKQKKTIDRFNSK